MQEKERLKNLYSKESAQKPAEAPKKANYEKFRNNRTGRVIQSSTTRETPQKEAATKAKDPQGTQVNSSSENIIFTKNFMIRYEKKNPVGRIQLLTI